MDAGLSGTARPRWPKGNILLNRFSAPVCNVYHYISPQADAHPCRRTTVSVFSILAMASGFGLQSSSSDILQLPYHRYPILYLVDIGRRLYRKPSFGATGSQDWHNKSLFIRMLIFLVILVVGGLYVSRGHKLFARLVSDPCAMSPQGRNICRDEYLQVPAPGYSRNM